MELYLIWLDRYERRPGEEPPIGLILCGEKDREQIELLQMDRGEILTLAMFVMCYGNQVNPHCLPCIEIL